MTFEDSNHRVTLSGNEISSILYIMEGYINPSDDYSYDPDFRKDVDKILEKLEEVADNWKGEFAEPKVTITPQQLEGDISTVRDSDYASQVDTLVGNMVTSDDNVFTHDSEGC